jgi:hypothetical protein
MDPMNTLDHSDTSPVISGGCNTDCTRTPIFAEKPELLRVVTRQPACPQAAPGHHDHPQLGSSTVLPKER